MQRLLKKFGVFFNRRSTLTENQCIGMKGESLARKYLKKEKKFKIITTNWRNPKDKRDEIDIIARDNDTLVFIEVKTRHENSHIRGYYAVNKHKKEVLQRTAKSYLQELKYKPKFIRFDIVEVKFCNNGRKSVNHFSNVKLFSKHFNTH